MDVKKKFQNGDLEEEIYMKQSEGFVVLGLGFTRRKEDHCVYFKLIGDHLTYLVLYVDDMLLIGNNEEII
jgi:hypothetical protein